MKKSETIIFFGNERLATGVGTKLPILKALVQSGYFVKAIIIVPSKPVYSRKNRVNEVAEFAKQQNIPIHDFSQLLSEVKTLQSYKATIGVLAAYGKIVPREIIDIFPKGIINIHPSLLPKHRGPIPIESAILSGETDTGVSLMQLDENMDSGPIFDQSKICLSGNDSKQDLADKLGVLGAQQLVDLLPDILTGKITPQPQSEQDISYDKRLTHNQGILDFTKTAQILEREVRAYYGWPRSKTSINSKTIIVTAAHAQKGLTKKTGIATSRSGELAISSIDGWLIIDRLIPAGGKEMCGADYLRGNKILSI